MKTGLKPLVFGGVLFFGLAAGCWALVALIAGLRQADWQITELMTQYLIATGIVKPTHTLVDFYSQIKGVEYLICLAFFVAFPIFYRYVNEDKRTVQKRT
jgi:hypothetical protein